MTLQPPSSHAGSGLMLPFSLTAAQIKASTLTPHVVIPAQGADTLIVPTSYVFSYVYGTTPFNAPSIDLVIGTQNLNALVTFLQGTVDVVQYNNGTISAGFSEGGLPADYANQPVSLQADLRGSIVSAVVGASGVDYVVGDTGTIDDGTPDATYIVTAVAGGGAVNGITITSGGGGYNFNTDWTTTAAGAQPGIGTGLEIHTVTINAAGTPGDGTITGEIYYVVASV